jgi:hypothetical protein
LEVGGEGILLRFTRSDDIEESYNPLMKESELL